MAGDVEPAIVADTRCRTGEGPLWHPDEAVVYWTDIPRGDLFQYDPARDDHERVLDHEGAIGGFALQDDGDLLLFQDRGRVQPWSPTGGSETPSSRRIPPSATRGPTTFSPIRGDGSTAGRCPRPTGAAGSTGSTRTDR